MGHHRTESQAVANAKKVIDDFANWTQSNHIDLNRIQNAYWEDLVPLVLGLVNHVHLQGIVDTDACHLMTELFKEMEQTHANRPQSMKEMVEIEKNYAYLLILWERQSEDEFKELVTRVDNARKGQGTYE